MQTFEDQLKVLVSEFSAAAIAYGADPHRKTYIAMARSRSLLVATVLMGVRDVPFCDSVAAVINAAP